MSSNPFVAVAGLTKADAVLVVVLVAIVVQSLAANVMNVYTAGLSLVNSAPRLGPLPLERPRGGRGDRALRASRTSSTTRRSGSSTSATSPPR